MTQRGAVVIAGDPTGWRPMRPYRGRRALEIRDPVVEPLWSGTRVIGHVAVPSTTASPASQRGDAVPYVRLIEELGADVAPELPELTAALADAVLAEAAVIDGIITWQVTLTGVGAAPVTEMRHRPALILRSRTELDVIPRGTEPRPHEGPSGFVAVDLLSLDGTSLLDVPLLERKRLLESLIEPGPLVRTSPMVRPPVDSWVATWKSVGLRGGILKAANSRYRPGTETVEWREVERLAGRR